MSFKCLNNCPNRRGRIHFGPPFSGGYGIRHYVLGGYGIHPYINENISGGYGIRPYINDNILGGYEIAPTSTTIFRADMESAPTSTKISWVDMQSAPTSTTIFRADMESTITIPSKIIRITVSNSQKDKKERPISASYPIEKILNLCFIEKSACNLISVMLFFFSYRS